MKGVSLGLPLRGNGEKEEGQRMHPHSPMILFARLVGALPIMRCRRLPTGYEEENEIGSTRDSAMQAAEKVCRLQT